MKIKNSEIEKELYYAMKRYRIPGLTAGIFKDGNIIFANGYGVANLEHSIPINLEMQFRIGSISKSFTAAAILMLAEEGKLKLDDSIDKFFANAPRAWKSITVEDLLAQKSGIADYLDKKFSKQGGIFDLRHEFKDAELIRRAYKLPIIFRPRKKFSYSNTNYMLLGFIIQRITGKFYYRYIKEKILVPLDMNSVAVHNNEEILYNRPSGYEISASKIINAKFASDTFNNTADGSLYCNILDMSKWSSLLYLNKILNRDSLEKMFSINVPINSPNYGYGFGWFIRKEKNEKIAEHTGSWGGFTAVVKINLSNKTAVAIFTNIYRGSSKWLLNEANKILKSVT
ncbi:MAG: serine hydrolase domain-containing protein [Candidatus Micrarchaeia archaeon]